MSDAFIRATERSRRVWSAGNWNAISDHIAAVGPHLLDRLPVDGARLLDIGTGSGGTVAVPAAQRGARVTGSDLVDTWFENARDRARAAGVEVDWVVADAAALPFADDAFDTVTSTFGHMFAPDQAAAAQELARVCRPGGSIGLCCWTPEGRIGAMFRTLGAHMPPPPEGIDPPIRWGDEAEVRGLLEPLGFELDIRREHVVMTFASEVAQVDMYEADFGPVVTAKAALGDRWPAARADLDAWCAEVNEAADGTASARYEYLEIVGLLTT